MDGNVIASRFKEYVVERKNKAGEWETVARTNSLEYAHVRFDRLRNNARIIEEYFRRYRADVWTGVNARRWKREVIETNY